MNPQKNQEQQFAAPVQLCFSTEIEALIKKCILAHNLKSNKNLASLIIMINFPKAVFNLFDNIWPPFIFTIF